MALSAPWIAKHLILGLQLYLSPNFDSLLEAQPPQLTFEYRRDNSNLFLIPDSEAPVDITVVELEASNTGNSFTANVSDGEVAVKATFSKGALELQTADPASTKLAAGSILRLKSFEFRLADYVEPPRVVLYLKKFSICGRDDLYGQRSITHIHDHTRAGQSLKAWKTQQSKWRMESSPNSPMEIRSQIGDQEDRSDDSDVEKQHLTAMSQIQFATQVPLRSSPKTAAGRTLLVEHDVQRRSNGRYDLVTKKLIVSPARNRARGHPAQKDVSQCSTDDLTSTAAELTQRQILAPASSIPRIESPHCEKGDSQYLIGTSHTEPQNCTPKLAQNSATAMPSAVLQLFRALRKECYDGRYIPRHLQIIPKDQVEILESDDQWQPPLVGRPVRPGTVPMSLLNHLTQKADISTVSGNKFQEISKTPDIVQQEDHTPNQQQQIESSSSSQASKDSSEAPDWSTSPLRAPMMNRQALPPDSSPPVAAHADKYASDLKQNKQFYPQDHSQITAVGVSTQHEVNGHSANEVSMVDNRDCDIGTVSQVMARPVHSTAATSMVPSQPTRPLPKQALKPNTSLQKTVQVKRTPFPIKEQLPHDSPPDSSANIIPGTFDERVTKQPVHAQVRNIGDFRRKDDITDQNGRSFEDDSSEDELATRRSQISSSRMKITSPIVPVDLPTPSLVETRNKVVKARVLDFDSGLKRKRAGVRTDPAKRCKIERQKAVSDQAVDADYRAIDENRAEFRRQYLRKIANGKETSQHIHPTRTQFQAEHSSVSSPTSTEDRVVLRSSPPLRCAEHSTTSDTHRSTHLVGTTMVDNGPINKSSLGTPFPYGEKPADTFTEFQSVYSDYEGQRKHFIAACQLLGRLHVQGKATHPSLWDDFVFHHYHNYRTHLQEVMETCGSALPYDKFYEECVEQPTHLQRIIRLPYINSLSTTSDPVAVPPSLTTRSAEVSDPPVNLSTDPYTFLNNPIATKRLVSNGVSASRSKLVQKETDGHPRPDTETDTQLNDVNIKVPENLRDSQNSQTSVKLWLEKAAGAESPILGTPVADNEYDQHVPTIDLNQEKARSVPSSPTLPEQRRKRTLPWTKKLVHGSDKASSSPANVQRIAETDTRHKTKHRLTRVVGEARKLPPKPTQAPSPSQPSPLSLSRNGGSSHDQVVETTFQRFAKLYGDLPSEKQALHSQQIRARKLIDIFAWRT